MFGGAVATSAAEQGGVVTLGATVAAADSDDTLGTVTITGLSNDLTNFNGGSYTASTGTWSGTAAQFDALTFKAGEDGVQHLTITAATTGAEAGSTTENYTLTVNPVAEGPVFGGAVATSAAEQGGVVTLGATVARFGQRRHAGHGDDHRAVERSDATSMAAATRRAPGPGAGPRRSSMR